MPKYDGDQVEVRVGTTTDNVASAPVLTNVDSVSYKVDQGITQAPTGIGFRTTEAHAKLLKYSGAITRYEDELELVSGGTGTLSENIGAFSLTKPGALVIQIKNKTTGRLEVLSGVFGDYAWDLKSPEGFIMETWDFKFALITVTEGT